MGVNLKLLNFPLCQKEGVGRKEIERVGRTAAKRGGGEEETRTGEGTTGTRTFTKVVFYI